MVKKKKPLKKKTPQHKKPTKQQIQAALAVLIADNETHLSRYFQKKGGEVQAAVVVGRCEHTGPAVYDAYDAIEKTHEAFEKAMREEPTAQETPLAPGVFQDAPLASDIDADKSAPTVPRAMFDSWFPANLAYRGPLWPKWCERAELAKHTDEDRGLALTFRLTGEAHDRIVWVRN